MLAAFAVFTVGIFIFIGQGRLLIKQKKKKEMIVFSSSLLLAVALYIGVVLKLPIPSLTEVIGKALQPVVQPIVDWTGGGTS